MTAIRSHATLERMARDRQARADRLAGIIPDRDARAAIAAGVRPGTRYGGTVVWPDGRQRRMTWLERFAWRFLDRRMLRP